MNVFLYLGAFWTMYGIAGLCGYQRIPKRCENQSWTKQYIRSSGISWLLLGIPWMLLYAMGRVWNFHWAIVIGLALAFSLPSVWYSVWMEQKYKVM